MAGCGTATRLLRAFLLLLLTFFQRDERHKGLKLTDWVDDIMITGSGTLNAARRVQEGARWGRLCVQMADQAEP